MQATTHSFPPLLNRLQRLLKVPDVYNEGVKKIFLAYISPTVSAAQRQFYVTYKSYISGSDDKVVDKADPESCASSCLSESSFICRSFEFNNSTDTCHMSTESSVTSALASSSNSRFFELSKYELPNNIYYMARPSLFSSRDWSICGPYLTARTKIVNLNGHFALPNILISEKMVSKESYICL